MRLLVVEDSARLRESLADGLSAAGYAVDVSPDGRDALASARAYAYDAIVLDVMLPELDGLAVLRTLRSEKRATPIILLTARDRVEQKVEGLRLGADDYLVKPFAFEELLARIESLCRRAHDHAAGTIEVAGLTLDLGARAFTIKGEPLELPPREFAVLEVLVLNAGRVLARHEIEEKVYDSGRAVWSNAIDSAVAAIRRALAARGLTGAIRTRRGIGYMFVGAPSEREA